MKLPPGVQPHEQWVVEPLHEEDEWGVPPGVVQANENSDGRVLAVYVYNSTDEPVELRPGEPVGQSLRAEVLPPGHKEREECLAMDSRSAKPSPQ